MPDLYPGLSTATTTNPNQDDPVIITAEINNAGSTAALNFNVKIEDVFPGQPDVLLGFFNVPTLAAGDFINLPVNWVATPAGTHYIRVSVDVNNTVHESDETNNVNDATIQINVIPFTPQLYVTQTDITFTPPTGTLSFGNPMTINATIHNNGTAWSNGTRVMFFNATPDANSDYILDSNYQSILIGETSINVDYGMVTTTFTTGISYTPPSDGTFTFYVWVNPLYEITELYNLRTDNLAASLPYVVTPRPNLAITSSDITFSDQTPLQGQTVMITARVYNNGGAAAVGPFFVAFYLDTVGTAIGTPTSVTTIPAYGSRNVFANWTPSTPGFHTIYVQVDTGSAISESSKTDNQASTTIIAYSAALDIIVNNATGPVTINSPIGVRGFILVEEAGVLTINSNLAVLQTLNNQFTIRVRQWGSLVINNADITTNNLLLDTYVEDSARVTFNRVNANSYINWKVSGRANVTMTSSRIDGNFDTLAGARASVFARFTVFSKALDDVRGWSNFTLLAVTVPSIRTYDNSNVTIYKYVSVQVLDGQPTQNAFPVQGARVNMTYALRPSAWLYHTAVTDSSGWVSFAALSDIITPFVYPSSRFMGNYMLDVWYGTTTPIVFSSHEYTSLMLAAYPTSTAATNYLNVTVQMWEVLPDLDPPVTYTPTNPGKGTIVNISTVVTNLGVADAHNVLIRFKDETTGEVIGDIYAPVIPAGGSYSTHVDWAFYVMGYHNVSVEVDPYHVISEISGGNNIGWATPEIYVHGIADISFPYSSDLYFSASPYVVGHAITVSALVHNTGDVSTGSFNVNFYNSTTPSSTTLLGTAVVANIFAGGAIPVSVEWTPTVSGDYNITAIADPLVEEISLTNNTVTGTLTVLKYSDLYISAVTFKPLSPVENNTLVEVTAHVHNAGEAPASSVRVQFWDGAQTTGTYIGQATIPYLTSGDVQLAKISWRATTRGRSTNHTITAVAQRDFYEGSSGGLSNEASAYIIVRDSRPDLQFKGGLIPLTANLIAGEAFKVNTTVFNNGTVLATNVTVEIFMDTIANNTKMGNYTISSINGLANKTISVQCTAFPLDGTYNLIAVIDRDLNLSDAVKGRVDEFIETNNNVTRSVTVALPSFEITVTAPTTDQQVDQGIELLVDGLVRNRQSNDLAPGVTVTVSLMLGTSVIQSMSLTSGADGRFLGSLSVPSNAEGQYAISINGTGTGNPVTVGINVAAPPAETPIWLYIIIIVIIVGAAIGGFTAYTYYFGIGKMVECGSCGAFIPEGATKCPKCGVEFETETAKCSVCSAWIPLDAKKCPECNAEFVSGEEDEAGYEEKMRKQYDEMVVKMRAQASKTLGPKMTDEQFSAWWKAQPTFITFDEWLREEEEMRKMGSKPCPQCGTLNSVTGKICHKCGTPLIKEGPKGKMPQAAAAAPAKVAAPAQAAPKETKKCPNCNMQVDVKEKICPVCGNDFERGAGAPPTPAPRPTQPAQQQPVQQQQQPQPGQPGMQPRPVVKKVVRAPIPGAQRVVIRKPGEPATEEKKEGEGQ